jgi:hypothetical protein
MYECTTQLPKQKDNLKETQLKIVRIKHLLYQDLY